jgi:hypothetical protein
MKTLLTHTALLLSDMPATPIAGSKEQVIIAVVLVAGALTLFGIRLWKKKK